jgi:hypothetical protein
MRSLLVVIAFLWLLNASVAHAQALPIRTPCGSPGVAVDREDCVRARLDTADASVVRQVGRVVELLPDSERRQFLDTETVRYGRLRGMCQQGTPGPLDAPAFVRCMTEAAQRHARELASRYPAARANAGSHGGCLPYEPDTVALTGRLERRTFPGLPNFESVTRGDEAETGFYLVVTRPLCVTRNVEEINQPAAGVGVVQLVLDQHGYDRLRASLGHRVTVRGTLFHSHTGHHHAELLLEVERARHRRIIGN